MYVMIAAVVTNDASGLLSALASRRYNRPAGTSPLF